ncbi:MAG: hypothetical protein M1818_000562 [Claussenomyces sp. TS43310]|nr:MAG: hypothetical protein M1818_000562 [Claussenomyces sp. TS43310]
MDHLDQTADESSRSPNAQRVDSPEGQNEPSISDGRYVVLRGRCSSSHASSQSTSEEEPLYINSSLTRNGRSKRSLSPICNGTIRAGTPPLSNIRIAVYNQSREEIARGTINKEILEWQGVCQSGMPTWSGPMSREMQAAGKRINSSLNVHGKIAWDILDDLGIERCFDKRRRAVTDSYLLENNIHDLAYLTAIRLPSASFTLPPDSLLSHKLTTPRWFEASSPLDMPDPDPGMMSSLRMHTDARYSPAFGYETSNNSLASSLQGLCDGTLPLSSDAEWRAQSSSIPLISDTMRGSQRPLGDVNACKDSGDESPAASHSPNSADLLVSTGVPIWYPGDPRRFKENHHKPPLVGGSRRTLQPVIRSESHPVYIQPVREIIVRRWKTLRQRLRRGLRNDGPVSAVVETEALAEDASPVQSSEPEHPPVNGAARERRIAARERGEIYGRGANSTPFNTPVQDPAAVSILPLSSPSWFGSPIPSPTLEETDRPVMSMVVTDTDPDPQTSLTPTSRSLNSTSTTSSATSSQDTIPRSVPTPSDATSTEAGAPRSPSPSFSPRRPRRRQQRRSRLSEVYTADDISDEADDGSGLSASGSALASPSEEPGETSIFGSHNLARVNTKLSQQGNDRSAPTGTMSAG